MEPKSSIRILVDVGIGLFPGGGIVRGIVRRENPSGRIQLIAD